MVKSIIPTRAPLDTRGLPDGYDPHKLYEYAITNRMASSDGFEWLLYKYIPRSLIKSFAIAIDPFSNLKMNSARITKQNRNQSRNRSSVLDQMILEGEKITNARHTIPNWMNRPGINSPYTVTDPPVYTKVGPTNYGGQQALIETLKDTTARTRALGSTQGEYELQNISIFAPARNLNRSSRVLQATVPTSNENSQVLDTTTYESQSLGPSGATLPNSVYREVVITERNYALAQISKYVLPMYNQASPLRPVYSLSRNLYELRDLPSSVISLRKAALDLSEFVRAIGVEDFKRLYNRFLKNSNNVPNEYLSYMFGWSQTYRDVRDLLQAPDRITKRINFLVARAGKDTTVRLKRRIDPSYQSLGSAFFVPAMPLEYRQTSRSDGIERSGELRIVLNMIFQFPDVMAPNFREKEFHRLIGLVPTPLDLYNIVPWSWLVDWFSGLNNYVECIVAVNSDRKLVNWGMITADLKSAIRTQRSVQTRSTFSSKTGNVTVATETLNDFSYTAEAILSTKIRRDVSTALTGIGTTSDVSTLSTFQKSILGALLLQRVDFRRGNL